MFSIIHRVCVFPLQRLITFLYDAHLYVWHINILWHLLMRLLFNGSLDKHTLRTASSHPHAVNFASKHFQKSLVWGYSFTIYHSDNNSQNNNYGYVIFLFVRLEATSRENMLQGIAYILKYTIPFLCLSQVCSSKISHFIIHWTCVQWMMDTFWDVRNASSLSLSLNKQFTKRRKKSLKEFRVSRAWKMTGKWNMKKLIWTLPLTPLTLPISLYFLLALAACALL